MEKIHIGILDHQPTITTAEHRESVLQGSEKVPLTAQFTTTSWLHSFIESFGYKPERIIIPNVENPDKNGHLVELAQQDAERIARSKLIFVDESIPVDGFTNWEDIAKSTETPVYYLYEIPSTNLNPSQPVSIRTNASGIHVVSYSYQSQYGLQEAARAVINKEIKKK